MIKGDRVLRARQEAGSFCSEFPGSCSLPLLVPTQCPIPSLSINCVDSYSAWRRAGMTQLSYRDLTRGRSGYPYVRRKWGRRGTHAVSAEAEVLQSCSGSVDSCFADQPSLSTARSVPLLERFPRNKEGRELGLGGRGRGPLIWGKHGEQVMLLFFVILNCVYGQKFSPSH